jgi:nucleoside-diphosphate-sugar epimerase
MTTPTAAITGATGLLGRHLCDYLRRRGWQVRGLARSTATYPFAEDGIRLYHCDLPDTIEAEALRDVDVVIHCAYTTRFTNLKAARRVNEDGTKGLLEASRAAGVRRFVFVSSIAADPGAASYYGRSKYRLEQLMHPTRDLVIRPGLILARGAGLFHRLEESIRRTPIVPVFWGGNQIVQTIHVDDLCQAFETALARDCSGALTIAEPGGLPMKALLRLIAKRLGRRCLLLPLPAGPIVSVLRLLERTGLRLPLSSENILGLKSMRHVATTEDLRRLDLRARTAQESLTVLL